MAPNDFASVTVDLRDATTPDTATVVWLRGEHDLSTCQEMSRTFATATAHDDADVVVDLSGVEFMDARILGEIVRTREAMRATSRTLSLRSPSALADRLIDLCGLGHLVVSGPLAPSGVPRREP